jgi:hypothetical protein
MTTSVPYSFFWISGLSGQGAGNRTDFWEGGDERDLVRQTEEVFQAGVRMIGLGALGYDTRPASNRANAKKLRKAGMDVLSCTPEKLADCMAQILRG